MNFDTPLFFSFFFVVVVVTYLCPSPRSRHVWLLIGSYTFYGAWDFRFLALIFFITVVSYYGTNIVLNINKSSYYIINIAKYILYILILSPLAVFKYFDFFSDSFSSFLGMFGLSVDYVVLNVILPVGISFYTFQALSYSFDVLSGRTDRERCLLRYALFVAFFPQLVAGPIIRASDFLPQLREEWKPPSSKILALAVTRFLWGLFKKVFIADRLAVALVDPAFSNLSGLPGWVAPLSVLGFGLLIYADFSAYSDMAISCAKILGFNFRENFLAPYWASSVREFWRRWHISLSSWIRDYIYIPLGGNRHGKSRWFLNLLLAMVLCGLWHGAAWNFVLWGAWHGLALLFEGLLKKWKAVAGFGIVLSWLFTQVIVYLGWLLFRSENLEHFFLFFQHFAIAQVTGVTLPRAIIGFVFAAAVTIYTEQAIIAQLARTGRRVMDTQLGATPVQIFLSVCIASFLLLTVFPEVGFRNFVYFQF